VVWGVWGVAGELELWNKAEAALEEALNSTGREWVMNPGDGAFYGPKIDITGELRFKISV
jgi:threonyl-tRNA synthetase